MVFERSLEFPLLPRPVLLRIFKALDCVDSVFFLPASSFRRFSYTCSFFLRGRYFVFEPPSSLDFVAIAPIKNGVFPLLFILSLCWWS